MDSISRQRLRPWLFRGTHPDRAMIPLISDPIFYAVAVPAVILVGLSKGGLGGAAGFIGVPMMALATSPVQRRRSCCRSSS